MTGSRGGRSAVADLELLVLGSGTSAGVPAIGCDCAVCRSDDPRDARTRPSACLRFRDARGVARLILIDTSPDLRAQALRERLDRCDAIVFTHSHVDHTFGLDDVRQFNARMAQAIDIYADADTLEFLRRVYAHIFADDVDRSVSFIALLRPRLIEPGRPVDLHGLRFTPLRLWHGDTAVLGYRIEALDGAGQVAREQPSPLPLAYCTDVSRIPAETWPRLESLRTLFLGMLRHTPHPKHFSVTEAVEAARRVGARRTWFVHMNHEISHADVDASLPEGMALGYDGLSVR